MNREKALACREKRIERDINEKVAACIKRKEDLLKQVNLVKFLSLIIHKGS